MDRMSAVSSYLERYLAGEHEQVWDDLVALGPAVREEPVYSDALAVAHETMLRVRHNIELLISRLRSLGYQFGYDWWNANYRDMLENDPPPPMFAYPRADVKRQLADLEAWVGLLPLSLRAWYEHIGAVNFVGMYPVEDPTDPEGFTEYVQWKRLVEETKDGRQYAGFADHDLDPLFVDDLNAAMRHLEVVMSHGYVCEFDIAPDEWFKYGVSGGGTYAIALPNPAADALLEGAEWHQTTFVNYLRICFKWAGFPGLECKSKRPEKELAYLTRDLLPI